MFVGYLIGLFVGKGVINCAPSVGSADGLFEFHTEGLSDGKIFRGVGE